jgi:hypothetical protein
MRPRAEDNEPMNRRLAFAFPTVGGATAESGASWRSAAERLCCVVPEARQRALAVFAPVLILPMVGTAGDIALLIWLYGAVLGIEAALALAVQEPASPGAAEPGPAEVAAAAGIGALALLAIAPLGLGALVTIMLYAGARAAAGSDADMSWVMTLVLGAVSTALLLDLALVALGLQRSSLWLALGAAVGMALATRQALATTDAKTCGDVADRSSRRRPTRSLLELAFACLLALVLALYGALLAHEPALRQLAAAGGYLTVPFLALALLRFAYTALDHARRPRPDRLAILLLVSWALSATWLMEV